MSPALHDHKERSFAATPEHPKESATDHFDVVIVGGGTAGISVAARIRHAKPKLKLAVVEPSKQHFYQPMWTLVGAGVFDKTKSVRPEASVIPPGVEWIQDAVTEFDPEAHSIRTQQGRRIGYRYLVVAAGIQINWKLIPGLQDAIGKNGVCSNYSFQYADYTWECIRSFQGGRAIFTQPSTAVKCGGAPQKIMYLADDAFRRNGVRSKSQVIFASANNYLFQVKKYEDTLYKVVERREIDLRLQTDLTAIRPESREAVFLKKDTGEELTLNYDLLHVTPPMGPPDFIRHSPLANADGWVDVNKQTLRHNQFPDVFAIGDVSSLPTSKTAAAIRKQAPVLVDQLLATIDERESLLAYDGYTSCPLITGYGKMVLAEFNYDKEPNETFPFDQSKERYSMWLLKAYGLPLIYWHGMLKGRM